MKCLSRICNAEFPRRHVKCPSCGYEGVRKLYKYKPINQFTWRMLKSGKIWCPTAKSLNDPFEFEFHLAERAIAGIPLIESEIAQAMSDMKDYGVLSFTEANDDLLMWSHYANSHTGICLGFERISSNELGSWDHCFPVLYHPQNQMLSVRPLDLNSSLSKILTTKANQWSYEQEWRLIIHVQNREIDYPGRLIEVVFGLATSDRHKKRVRSILGDTVRYFQAVKSERFYAIGIEPT